MATFLNLQDRTYDVLRDSAKVFVTITMVKAWINEAYLDVNARLGILRKNVDDTFDANGKDVLPADFIRQTNMRIQGDTATSYRAPAIVSDETFFSWKNLGSTPGTTLVRFFGGSIETYPAAASKLYSMEYVYKPTALSADGDIPALPEELHIKLQNYARAMGHLVEDDQENASLYFSLYNEGLPTAPNAIERDYPGPFGFVPASSYWDREN